MMKESLSLTEVFSAEPNEVYEAWLDGNLHEKMTGAGATGSNEVGTEFTAWDGYISGKNLELHENKKIVQTWRTTEFSDTDEDSILTVELNKTELGTHVTLTQTNIPEGQTQYEQGWLEHYFAPMKAYFSGTN